MSKAIIRPRMTPSRIGAAAAHRVQALVELVHQPADRLAEHDDHQQPGDDAGQQRDDQHRHQAAGPGRHLPAGDPVRDHAGEHAADDARRGSRSRAARRGRRTSAPEDVGGEATHHEAGRDAGAVGDRVGDVAGQRRDEEHERGLADDEEHRADVGHEAGAEQGVVEPERRGVGQVEERVVDGDVAVRPDDLVAAEQEATARSAGRPRRRTGSCRTRRSSAPGASRPPQLSPAPAPSLPRGTAAGALDARGVRVVGVAQRLGDHRVGLVDRALHARGDHRLAGEPAAGRGPRRRRRRSRPSAAAIVSRGSGRGAGRALGLDLRCRPRPARRRPRGPRRPCRCARCRSGRR